MNRVLAFLFFMLFLSAFALIMLKDMRDIGSARDEDRAEQIEYSIVSGDWRPVAQTAGGPESTFVNFGRDGSIYGFGGCNSFTGSYVATDSTVSTGPLSMSRKACAEPVNRREVSFIRAIESAKTYNIDGATLILYGSDEDELQLHLVTRAQPPKSVSQELEKQQQ